MKLFPAIDIMNGRAVRLLYGKKNEVTDFGNPVDCAKRWIDEGAEILHIVDLSGAFGEDATFNRILEQITRLNIPVQSGGGLRSMKAISERFDCGADRLILGTVCVKKPEVFEEAVSTYKEKIVAGIDAKDGFLAVHGWTEIAPVNAFEFGKRAKSLGVADAVFTDIGRDGALKGVNLEETVNMAQTGLNIIASGGIKDMDDLYALKEKGVYGAILGRSIYTGHINLQKAVLEMSK